MEIIAETENVRIGQLDVSGSMWANAYLVTCTKTGQSALIDASGKADLVLDQIREKNLKYVLMTHNHKDHIGALPKLKSTLKIPVYGHAKEPATPGSTPPTTLARLRGRSSFVKRTRVIE